MSDVTEGDLRAANDAADREQTREQLKKTEAECPGDGFPPIFIDAHMHIQSGSCAPLPPLHGRFPLGLKPGRGFINWFGKTWIAKWFITKQIGDMSAQPTEKIGKDLVELNSGQSKLAGAASASFLGVSVVLTMDMDYCHIDGYEGLPIYFHETEGDRKGDRYYLKRKSGNAPRSECKKIYVEWKEDIPLDVVEFQQGILDARADPKKSAERKKEIEAELRVERRRTLTQHAARQFEQDNARPYSDDPWTAAALSEQYEARKGAHVKQRLAEMEKKLDEALDQGEIGIDVADEFLRDLGSSLHETWAQQVLQTERVALSHPLRTMPMYHYDPRRYVNGGRDAPFSRIVKNGGIFIGFKMYTSQGYMPREDTAAGAKVAEVTAAFFARCAAEEIPVMTHCTPAGFYTHQRDLYVDLASESVQREHRPPGAKELRETDRRRYFQQKFVHPEAWRPVLEANKSLRLCLAHFASDKVVWKEDPADLDKPTVDRAALFKIEEGMSRYNVELAMMSDGMATIGDTKDLLDAYWAAKNPYPGHARPGVDADGTMYEKGWLRSIVDLCLCPELTNCYTDISYLPLFERLKRGPHDPARELKRYWAVLAEILKKRAKMIDHIMFGTDWYMILMEPFRYPDWFDDTRESLHEIEKELGTKQDLFHQFAIVNPIRFYRLDKIGDQLVANLEKKIGQDRHISQADAMRQLEQHKATLKRIKEGPGTLEEMVSRVKAGPLPFTRNAVEEKNRS